MCRSRTSHLSRVKKELQDRLHITRKDQSTQHPPKNNTTKPKKERVQPVAQLREPKRHEEEGETGATNSAKSSVLLVLHEAEQGAIESGA